MYSGIKKHLLFIFITAIIMSSPLFADDAEWSRGYVAQMVTHFYLPTGEPALALVHAYSDTLSILVINNNGPDKLLHEFDTGINPGPANDLPRYLIPDDINKDGFTDIIVLCSGNPNLSLTGSIQIFEGRPDNTFLPKDPFPVKSPNSQDNRFPVIFRAADLDNDNFTDLVIGFGFFPGVAIYRGREMFNFEFRREIILNYGRQGSPALSLADLDNDGFHDIVAGSGNNVYVVEGSGNMQFLPPNSIELSSNVVATSMVIADIDYDSRLDIILGDSNGFVHVIQGLAGCFVEGLPILSIKAMGNSPSLNVSDVLVIDWNRDSFLEIVAVNRLNNCVSIISPSDNSKILLLPTDNSPRRICKADINLDGVPDLITANEGDLTIPGNSDLSFLLNPNRDKSRIRLKLLKRVSFKSFFPFSVKNVSAAFILPDASCVIADVMDRKLVTLSKTASHAGFEKVPFPMPDLKDISGLAKEIFSTGISAGAMFVMERRKPVIFEFQDGILVDKIEIKNSEIYDSSDDQNDLYDHPKPGDERNRKPDEKSDFPIKEITYSGLNYDSFSKQFWLLVPEKKELWVLERNGQLVWKYFLSKKYTKLAIDFNTMNIFLGDSSSSSIDRYKIFWNSIILRGSIPLRKISSLLSDSGVNALAWDPSMDKLAVFTTDRLWVTFSTYGWSHIDPSVFPLSHGNNVHSLSTDSSNGNIYALDLDSIPMVISMDKYGKYLSSFSLGPFLRENPGFKPGTIAFDFHSFMGEQVLIADKSSSFFALFNTDGMFRSFINWAPVDGSWDTGRYVSGFDVDESTGNLMIRNRQGLSWLGTDGSYSSLKLLDYNDPGDISKDKNNIYALAPECRRLDKLKNNVNPEGSFFLGAYFKQDIPLGIATRSEENMVYISSPKFAQLLIFLEEKISLSEPSWNAYE
jgi:VCBS repeat protein